MEVVAKWLLSTSGKGDNGMRPRGGGRYGKFYR